MNIQELAAARAHWLARWEYLEGMYPLSDSLEYHLHTRAVQKAKAYYLASERALNSATATLTNAELKRMGLV